MKKILFSLFLSIAFLSTTYANYTTPGTGVKFTLVNLVTNAGGDVTFTGEAYLVNDTITISLNDTLEIKSNATVKFAAGTLIDVNGAIIINPPTAVLFTAQNIATGYLGMRININSPSILRKLTFEYAVSLRLTDCNITIDSCVIQYNNNSTSTTFGNGAIALFRSHPIITNSQFLNNQRAAIQSGSNGSSAPKIINCLFMANNTTNQNVPQINLGSTGLDTAKILNNQLLRASTRSGGIGFLSADPVRAVITGNVIKNNRYGITFNGGANIYSLISYNVIDSNNTEGNPTLGGSGISYSGGSATSHQNSIVTGNYIRWNLWGITIQPNSGGGAQPNLGNIVNTDTTDDGKNFIYGNTNATTPRIELYNNTVDDIMAQNNYWGSNDPDTIEARIFHRIDNGALGLVNFTGFRTLPVELVAFNGSLANNSIVLYWLTSMESKSDYFDIERSDDGRSFYSLGKVFATGNSSSEKEYRFTDKSPLRSKQYYRLKLVDADGKFKYSNIISLARNTSNESMVKIYPTLATPGQPLTAEIVSATAQQIMVQFITVAGKLVGQFSKKVVAGTNIFLVHLPSTQSGILYLKVSGKDLNKTLSIIRQ